VYTEYVKVPLDSGSLLIMEGAIQNDWQVAVVSLVISLVMINASTCNSVNK